MIVSEKVSVWLTSRPDFAYALSYSDRQRLKEGSREDVLAKQIRKKSKEVRLFNYSAGAIGVLLAIDLFFEQEDRVR